LVGQNQILNNMLVVLSQQRIRNLGIRGSHGGIASGSLTDDRLNESKYRSTRSHTSQLVKAEKKLGNNVAQPSDYRGRLPNPSLNSRTDG
jgi:hypothetical protein